MSKKNNIAYVVLVLITVISTPLFGQVEGLQRLEQNDSITQNIASDTLTDVVDSLLSEGKYLLSDSILVTNGDIETTIKYNATDSMNLDMVQRKIFLYGEAHIEYGDIKLDADYIEINWVTSELMAKPTYDSLGNPVGRPVFDDGRDSYETDEIRYNFKTRKAFIKGVVTKQGDGFVLGSRVKKDQENNLYVDGGRFCPCDDPNALTYFKAAKIKMIPGDKVITSPFNLFIGDVPTPIGFLFGMFPLPKTRSSGIIFPTYGEEARRGFFLRNGGYYFDINDYIDLAILGEIYSRGSHGFSITSNYSKRYAFRGNLNFRYNSQLIGTGVEDTIRSRDYWVNWSFNPETKGRTRFSANVSAGSNGFNQNNVTSYAQQTRAQFNSNVSLSTSFDWGTFSTNARHNQNVVTGEWDITLPDFAVNVNRINPFLKKGQSASTWYQKLNFNYSVTGTNQVNNRIRGLTNAQGQDSVVALSAETLPLLLQQARNGIQHRIPASTSFKVLKYFTMSPSLSYTERWYFEKLDPFWDSDLGRISYDTLSGFARAPEWNTGASMNTVIYGSYYPIFDGPVKQIRHVMTPSLAFSYRPDFSTNDNLFKIVYDSVRMEDRAISRFQGFAYGAPGAGRSGNLTFNLNNTFEMKVNKENDTIDEDVKVPLLQSLNFSASYNLIADSFRLSPINFQARTTLFNNNLNVSVSGRINPYYFRLDSVVRVSDIQNRVFQTRVDRYAWQEGQGLGQLEQFVVALSTNFNPKGRQADEETRQKIENASPEDQQFLPNDPSLYINWEVPWNLRLNYNFRYSRQGAFGEPDITQSLSFGGDVKISQKWNIGFNSGFDIERTQFTQTNIRVTRDLNCWQMSFVWIPFGRLTSYDFNLQIKAPTLKDLKLSRRRDFRDFF